MEDVKTKLKLSALAGRAGYAYARVMRSPLFASALLVTVLIWEFGVLFLKASRKLFWYDELLTFHVSNLHPFSLLWRALQAGVDGMPPGYYILVQLARRLPGDPLVTLRLPSILGYLISLLGVYWFARRKLPAFAGLAAVLLITLSPFREYALEARSYSLLVGFLAISAVLWQRIDEKRFMTPLFALFLTLAVSCHHYAVVAVSFFGIAELTWTLLSRRIRWGVWAACLLATSPFFLGLPLLLHMRDIFGKNFWARPDWGMAVSTYTNYLGLAYNPAFVLILFFGLVVGDSLLRMMRQPREGPPERDFSLPEIILVGGFLFYPALLVVLTKLLGGGYTYRYGFPTILGLVLGSVYLVRTIWLKSSSAYLLVALLIAFAHQGESEFRMLYKAGSTRVDERWAKLAELSREETGIPVVIGGPVTYLEAAEYAPPELRANRLVHVVDPDIATRLIGSDSADKLIRLLAQFIPLRVEDLAAFQTAHQRFILYSGGSSDWFTQYLLERRYHLRLLSKDGGSQTYIAER
jgi:hypothetical protein